jgi:uncharacterized protein (DUF927 family)
VNNFLETILPTQGTYCLFTARNGQVHQTFHTSVEALAAAGDAADKSQRDTYYALATFNGAEGGRKQANALFLRTFFTELDCGVGKPFADHNEAAAALMGFVAYHKLPKPTVVNSGGGLHVYWVMNEDIPVAQWKPVADSLKGLCLRSEHGLAVDPNVPGDSARVLRIPGTHNYKLDVARAVQVLRVGKPTDFAAFKALLPLPLMDFSIARNRGTDTMTQELAGAGDFPATSFLRIARRSLKGTGCAQIAFITQNVATLEEPLWRAGLSIAQCCEDKDLAIQKISMGHPGYHPEAAMAKAAATKGPYTCEWFGQNYPSRCEGCAHKVTSPIALGRMVSAAPVTEGVYVVESPLHAADPDAPAGAVVPTVAVTISAYPWPYFRGVNGGVFMHSKDPETTDDIEVEIYPRDLYLTSRFVDFEEDGSGDGELVGVNLHLEHDGIRRFTAPITDIFSPDKLRDVLVKHGAIVYGKHTQTIMNYFGASVRQLQSQYAANRTRNQMGWTPDATGFVIGELEYVAGVTKLAPPASGIRQIAASFQPHGTIAGWKAIADFYDRPGLEAQALTLLFGFGSPLLKLIGGTAVRGAMVHLVSNTSGTGKTTAQQMVNSIFGHPRELLLDTKDSMASKYHRLGIMNSLSNTVDEITNISAEELSDWVYGVTSGRGRHRMEASSNKLRTNHATWCNITITSGNASVIDRLAAHKSTSDGELRRVLELHVPRTVTVSKAESDAIFGELPNNYGVAGPVFIQYVLDHREHVIQLLTEMQQRIDNELGLSQSDRFHSVILACAFVGGHIARECGLLSIDIQRVYKYALQATGDNKAQNLLATGSTLTVAQETLTAYINENINSVLVINSVGRGGIPTAPIREVRGNQLKVRYEPDKQELFVVAGDFRRFLQSRQVDVQRSIQALVASGVMRNNGVEKSKRIGAGALAGVPSMPTRCYSFDGAAIGLDAHAFDGHPQAQPTL